MSDFESEPFRQSIEVVAYKQGRASMKAEILAIVESCLARDPTLQKLAKQIREIE